MLCAAKIGAGRDSLSPGSVSGREKLFEKTAVHFIIVYQNIELRKEEIRL